jgi:hypothetical protein
MPIRLEKGMNIAIHVLDEHILPLMPTPIPLGGRIDDWETYWAKCSEVLGPDYDQAAIIAAGYFVTMVEDLVGDQVLFRDSYDELRLAPANEVITEQEAPAAFEAWLSQRGDKDHA